MKVLKLLIILAVLLLIVVSCSAAETPDVIDEEDETSTDEPCSDISPIPTVITPQQAEEMMTDAIILDVRTQSEFDSGHIAHAILLPYDEVAALAATILPDKNRTILIYCRTGRRSNIAALTLAELGYTSVYDFGGIVDWHGPIVTGG